MEKGGTSVYHRCVNRLSAAAGSAVFLVIAPGVVAGAVPWWISQWRMDPPLLGVAALRIVGGAMAAAGAIVLVACFARFALDGLGTPAPVLPTRHLVVAGWYRYVRNPMYVAVVAAILGQALLFGNTGLLVYGAVVWLLFHAFVLLYEEPALRATFGAEYDAFRAEVPRWIPRWRRG
jgi:protein-S-isoprenylcysteine O-methyltransferase Ste14